MADMQTEPFRGLSPDWPRAVRVANQVARRAGRRHRVFRKHTCAGPLWAIQEVGAPDA